MPPSGGTPPQLPANAASLLAAIGTANSVSAFAAAVTAASKVMDVRFWADKGSANIDLDSANEPNVQAMLKYTAPQSNATQVLFGAEEPPPSETGGGGSGGGHNAGGGLGISPVVLTQSFLKVPGSTTTAAYSDNSTPDNPGDDQLGRVGLHGSEKVTVGASPLSSQMPPSGGTPPQLPANAASLLAAIGAANSVSAFAAAVTAASKVMDVRFWADKGSANIDLDSANEPNVKAMLKYTAPQSNATQVLFGAEEPPPSETGGGLYQGDDIRRGGDGADTLEGGGSDNLVLIGAGGNDLGRGLAEGDVFVGGAGVDTAQLPGAVGDYVVKLATPGQRALVRGLSLDTFSEAQSVFAIVPKSAPTGLVLVQSELLKFGDAEAAVDPMSLVAGGALVVNNSVSGAFGSIAAAIAAAANGATIIVSAVHVDPAAFAPIIVNKNDLHIVLENDTAPPLTFQLAEVSTIRALSLFGVGAANLIGNGFDNTLIGNAGPNTIDGRGGNDWLLGERGDDELFGGAGQDWLDGGEGADRLFGGSGNDVLLSMDAAATGDILVAGSGNDLLIAGSSAAQGPVRMMGGSGSDVFRIASVRGALPEDSATDAAPSRGVNAFIADLTTADGLDLSALRTSADGLSVVDPLPAGVTVSGDYRIALDTLYTAGLERVTSETGVARESAPIDALAVGSSLAVALAGPSEIAAAVARTLAVPSMQELADAMLPGLYLPLSDFAGQLYA
ncbi:MAG: calcium-binding protein [Betaproteobacteria bacterium]|nr:calcium-binding protein [Betaproteobacteria bacterium]